MNLEYLTKVHESLGIKADVNSWINDIKYNDAYLSKVHIKLGITDSFNEWKKSVFDESVAPDFVQPPKEKTNLLDTWTLDKIEQTWGHTYEKPVLDVNGEPVVDEEGYPVYEIVNDIVQNEDVPGKIKNKYLADARAGVNRGQKGQNIWEWISGAKEVSVTGRGVMENIQSLKPTEEEVNKIKKRVNDDSTKYKNLTQQINERKKELDVSNVKARNNIQDLPGGRQMIGWHDGMTDDGRINVSTVNQQRNQIAQQQVKVKERILGDRGAKEQEIRDLKNQRKDIGWDNWAKHVKDAEVAYQRQVKNGIYIKDPNKWKDNYAKQALVNQRTQDLFDSKITQYIEDNQGVLQITKGDWQKDEVKKAEEYKEKLQVKQRENLLQLDHTKDEIEAVDRDIRSYIAKLRSINYGSFDKRLSSIDAEFALLGEVDETSSREKVNAWNDINKKRNSVIEEYKAQRAKDKDIFDEYEGLVQDRGNLYQSYKNRLELDIKYNKDGTDLVAYMNMMNRNGHNVVAAVAWIASSALGLASGIEGTINAVKELPEDWLFAYYDNDKSKMPTIVKMMAVHDDVKDSIRDAGKENFNNFIQNINANVQKPTEFGDIELSWDGLGDLGSWALNAGANFIPQVGLMYLTGGASIYIMGASAFGSKYDEMDLSNRLGYSDYSLAQKWAASSIVGGSEVLSESFTYGIFKAKNLAGPAYKRIQDGLTTRFLQTMNHSNLRYSLPHMWSESASEGAAQIGNNVADKYVLGKHISLWDDVPEAMATGLVMERTMSMPGIYQKLSGPFRGADYQQQLSKNAQRLNELETLLGNKDITPELRESLENKWLNLVAKNEETMAKNIENVDMMSNEEKTNLIKLDVDIHNLKAQEDAINADEELSNDQKETLIEELNNEETELIDKKDKLLEQFESDETRAKKLEVYEQEKKIVQDKVNKFNKREIKGFNATNSGRRGKVREFKTREEQQAFFNDRISKTNSYYQAEIDGLNEMLKNPDIPDSQKEVIKAQMYDIQQAIESNNQQSKQRSRQFGFISQMPDGSFEIFINKENSLAKGGRIHTAAHEFLHSVLFKGLNRDPEIQAQVGQALGEFMVKKKGVLPRQFTRRLDPYLADQNFGEEVVTITSESLMDNTLKYDEGLFTKLGDVLRQFFQRHGLMDIRFDTGRDVYNFIKDYNASIEKSYDSKAVDRLMDHGVEGKLVKKAKKAPPIKEGVQPSKPPVEPGQTSKAASDRVQKIYEEKGVGGAMDIIKEFKPITSRLVEKRKEAPGFDRELLTSEIELGERGILDLIRKYNPDSGVPLAAYINTHLPKRAIEASKRILGEEFMEDIAERVDIAAEEVTPEIKKPKKRKTILSDRLGVKSKVDKAIANKINRLNINTLNFKTLKDLAPEVTGELFGINPKKLETGANITKGELQSAQMFIAKNSDLLLAMLPEGSTGIGASTGVQNVLLKAFYNKKPVRAKTKPGLRVQVKKPNITKKQFLEQFGIIDGKPVRTDRNTSARVLALARQLGKMMTNQSVREQLSKDPTPKMTENIVRISDGKSSIMFSQDTPSKQDVIFGGLSTMLGEDDAIFYEKLPEFVNDFVGVNAEKMTDNQKNAVLLTNDIDSLKISLKNTYGKDISPEVLDKVADKLMGIISKLNIPKKPRKIIKEVRIIQGILKSVDNENTKIKEFCGSIIDNTVAQEDLVRQENRRKSDNVFFVENFKQNKEQAIADLIILGGHSHTASKIADGRAQFYKHVKDYYDYHLNSVNIKPVYKTFERDGKTVYELDVKATAKANKLKNIPETKAPQSSAAAVRGHKKSLKGDRVEEQARRKHEKHARRVLNEYVAFNVERYNAGIQDHVDIQLMMGSLLSNMNSVLARAAKLKYIQPGVNVKNARYEHMQPRVVVLIKLVDAHINRGGVENIDDFLANYDVAIIDTKFDKAITDAGLGNRLGEGQAFEDWSGERYYGEETIHDSRLQSLVEFGTNKVPNEIKKRMKVNEKLKKLGIKSVKELKSFNTLDKAMLFSRSGRNPVKGMSAWDFDDTLARTKSGVRYKLPNPTGEPQPKRKVIFLAGGAGSGKSNVVKQLGLKEQGFKIVNQDAALEWLKKNHGLPANMEDLTPEQLSQLGKLSWEARQLAKTKLAKHQGNGDGIVVDGTGASLSVMEQQVKEFRDRGYDVQMVFVETSEDVAVERNKARKERSLKEKIVRSNWKKVQGNKNSFKKLFGENFAEVNTNDLRQNDPMPIELVGKLDKFTKGYIKGRLEAGEFADKGADLAAQGAEFDFVEFDIVKEGEKGPLFGKAIARAKKFGTKDTYIITARPHAAKKPIHEFLKSQGLNIPLENIITLEDSTSEAKALWIAEMVGDGYNDIYFADDALQNIQAVKNMLDQFDVKSKTQRAKIQFSKDIDSEFNKTLERTKGVGANKRFSQARARQRGKNIGRYNFLLPPSAQDFEGIIQYFYGTKAQGLADKAWFKKVLFDPLNKAYTQYYAAKQRVANEWKQLKKTFPSVAKSLNKKIPDSDFTHQDAIRVYLWDKAGFDIPGLSNKDRKKLVSFVQNNVELKSFADTLSGISRQEKGYLEPGEYWLTEDIRIDLIKAIDKVGRKKYFAEFIENAKIMFSPENLNKIEYIFGSNFREALEDMLYSIEHGTNRTFGQNRLVNRFTNWLNGAIGVVMNFNMRSATLQSLSTVNFINWGDNNIFKAAKAFANLRQYWKDFSYIFNSDFLKQRRAGLKIDVNAAELTEYVQKSKEPIRAAINWFLKKGFLPTQFMDSFAIATGGATFYRNRLNTYLKQGLNQKEAEDKAWQDFQEIAEKTQQSARPDMLSQQQKSVLGRWILAFQNIPSQFVRISQKEALDLINGRYIGFTGPNSFTSKVGKIAYYAAIQNVIFYGLQQSLFAVMFSDDEEDEKFFKRKKERVINGMIDSLLRGMGVGGAVVSTLKNMVIKFAEQQGKSYNPDESAVLMEFLMLSPPIGIKARQIVNAQKTYQYNKHVMKEMETFDIDNPLWTSVGNVVEATTNIPMARIHNKIMNIREVLNQEHAAWQRVFLFLGWNRYNLGIKNEEIEQIKKEILERKAYERKQKDIIKKEKEKVEAQTKIEKEVKKEKEQEKKGEKKEFRCSGVKSSGERCNIIVSKAGDKCTIHESAEQRTDGKKSQCKKVKSSGKRCKMQTASSSGYCYYHD